MPDIRKRRETLLGTLAFLVVSTAVSLAASPAVAQIDPPSLWEAIRAPNIESPPSNGDLAWADYDGDGDLDVFVTGYRRDDPTGAFGQLYANDGFYTFTTPENEEVEAVAFRPILNLTDTEVRNTFGVWRGSVAWGDYTGGGAIGLATTGITRSGGRRTRIYRNALGDPSGAHLLLHFDFETGVSEGDIAWVDYDTDGDLDLVITGLDDDEAPMTKVFENRVPVNLPFVERDVNLPALWKSRMAWGDYDNDGDMDVVMTGVTESLALSTRLYANSGTGTFSDTGVELPLLLSGSVAWGDGDADGDLDLLVTGGEIGPFLLDGRVYVFENSGGTFSGSGVQILGRFGEPGTGRYGGDAAWGDFNHDGQMDFFVSGHASTVSTETGRTYESLGNLQFSYSTVGFSNGAFASGANGATVWGDLEGDGDLDLLTSAHDPAGNPIARLYLNHLTAYPRNTRPEPPELLGADVDGSTVTLSWGAGHDDQTPTPALTYNVRIGRVPGAHNMMPAMSGPDGTRRLSASGNAGHNLTWSVRNLDSGTYYWSVQTIDTSFKGSPFAEEGQFTIP